MGEDVTGSYENETELDMVQEIQCGEEVSSVDLWGSRVAVGVGGAVGVWRWEGGRWECESRVGGAHRWGVGAVRWGEAGAVLASGGGDGAVRLWGGAGRGALTSRGLLGAGGGAVRALGWGGPRLASGHDDGAARLWLPARGLLLATLPLGGGALHALTATGPLLLTNCSEGVLKLWPLHSVVSQLSAGRPLSPPLLWVDATHDPGALCAAHSPDDSLAATGGHDEVIQLWALAGTPRQAGQLRGHESAVTALSWGRLLASGSLDHTARLWKVRPDGSGGTCLVVLPAHERYLTAVALHPSAGLLVTASIDGSLRTWSLAPFTPSDPLDHPCDPLQHYGVGDLKGIEPIGDEMELHERMQKGTVDRGDIDDGKDGDNENDGLENGKVGNIADGKGAQFVASAAHQGAVNGIASDGDTIATASSDGCLRVFRWNGQTLELQRTAQRDGYPMLAVAASKGVIAAGEMGGGCLLLGTDDSERFVEVSAGQDEEYMGDTGGVRGVALSPHQPPLLLLATDDGGVSIYTTDGFSNLPEHEYEPHQGGAALCVSWYSAGEDCRGRQVLASGGESGAIRLHSPPPNATTILTRADAHELGVVSMDFAKSSGVGSADVAMALLATAGCDGTLKLWSVHWKDESVSLQLARVVCEAGGGMAAVRWGWGGPVGGLLLAGGGSERWVRVWRVGITGSGGGVTVRLQAAAPVRHPGGAVSVLLLDGGFLALGTMGGEMTIWKLPALDETEENGGEEEEDDELSMGEEWSVEAQWEEDPRWWGERGVRRWLRESVGVRVRRQMLRGVTGARLVEESEQEIVEILMIGVIENEPVKNAIPAALHPDGYPVTDNSPDLRSRLMEELRWLRTPPPPAELARVAPHSLLCPLTHRLLRWPVRAADGITYGRAACREWFLANGGCVSWLTGRRLHSTQVAPNIGAVLSLRSFLSQHGAAPPPAPP